MENSYTTIKEYAEDSFIERRSEFIGYITPIKTEDEAISFINKIKEQHRKATHNCYAYILRDNNTVRYSDDGEPQGTSGAPMVMMMVNAGITNVCVVVTRYFGGIKLGTGGLARAYTSSAKLGLEAAGICEVWEQSCLTFSFDYTYLAKLQNLMQMENIFDSCNAAILTIRRMQDPTRETRTKIMIEYDYIK